jgi:hypothetical protein
MIDARITGAVSHTRIVKRPIAIVILNILIGIGKYFNM